MISVSETEVTRGVGNSGQIRRVGIGGSAIAISTLMRMQNVRKPFAKRPSATAELPDS